MGEFVRQIVVLLTKLRIGVQAFDPEVASAARLRAAKTSRTYRHKNISASLTSRVASSSGL